MTNFLRFVLPTLGVLGSISGVFGESLKDGSASARQAPVFSSTIHQYPEAGSDSGQHQVTIYDTLTNQRPSNSVPSEAYTNSQQTGKSSFGLSSLASADSSAGYSHAYPSPAPANSYLPVGNRPTPAYPEPPRPTVVGPQPPQLKPDESYAYYYQHYPAGPQQFGVQTSYGGGAPNLGGFFDSDIFGGLGSGDLGAAGGALGGLGGLGALGLAGLAALAKGALAIKPLLIFGLILLVLLPLLILFLPIPIITIPTPTTPVGGRAHELANAMTSLTQKVLGAEECLERILCKIPPVPKKFQEKARGLWTEYGSKVIPYARVTRGLEAYFNSTDVEAKHRAFKCNSQFKCSNKFF